MPINIHGNEYVTVAERVKAIHEKLSGKFSIETEIVQFEPSVVVKATVTIDGNKFTGISGANDSKQIEKMTPYEVAETSAVGRALGFAGYGVVDSIASADEMVKATAKPKQFTNTKATTPMTTGTTSNNATKAQMSWINQRLIEAGFDTEKADWASLTFQNASDYFNKKIDIDDVANILKLEK